MQLSGCNKSLRLHLALGLYSDLVAAIKCCTKLCTYYIHSEVYSE